MCRYLYYMLTWFFQGYNQEWYSWSYSCSNFKFLKTLILIYIGTGLIYILTIIYCCLFSWSLPFWLGVWCNLGAILICISFMAKDEEHFFMYSFPIYNSSFKNCLFNQFAHLLVGLFVLLVFKFLSNLCIWILICCQMNSW
jgi:hypothetical protein